MNSIRSSLVAMLMAAFTLTSFLAALNGYRASMAEAEQLLDSHLSYASDILILSGASGMVSTRHGDKFAFQIWRNGELTLRSALAPETQISALEEGFRYSNFSGYRWRSLTRRTSDGSWYLLAERADQRRILAEKVVLESVLPLLLWLPVSAILVWILVAWGLRPLRDLSRQINLKRSDDLEPVEYLQPPAELVPLIESTNSLLARLSASFEREKHFAAHAAHELRTPLAGVKLHLHNLGDELPAGHAGLAHANAGVARMHHLVEQILDLNRTNPEIMQAKFQEVALQKLARSVTAAAWPAFEARQQSLSLSGDEVSFAGDEGMVETLLQNLLDNAGKYTPHGGKIEVIVSAVGNSARLQVRDTGPGISAGEREKVFDRFYRAGSDTSMDTPGAGLGLTIVRHIAQLHGAELRLQDNSPRGLCVTVDFPLHKEPI